MQLRAFVPHFTQNLGNIHGVELLVQTMMILSVWQLRPQHDEIITTCVALYFEALCATVYNSIRYVGHTK